MRILVRWHKPGQETVRKVLFYYSANEVVPSSPYGEDPKKGCDDTRKMDEDILDTLASGLPFYNLTSSGLAELPLVEAEDEKSAIEKSLEAERIAYKERQELEVKKREENRKQQIQSCKKDIQYIQEIAETIYAHQENPGSLDDSFLRKAVDPFYSLADRLRRCLNTYRELTGEDAPVRYGPEQVEHFEKIALNEFERRQNEREKAREAERLEFVRSLNLSQNQMERWKERLLPEKELDEAVSVKFNSCGLTPPSPPPDLRECTCGGPSGYDYEYDSCYNGGLTARQYELLKKVKEANPDATVKVVRITHFYCPYKERCDEVRTNGVLVTLKTPVGEFKRVWALPEE